MIRVLYAILTYLLLPVYALYWLVRGTLNRAYWDRVGQRFGRGFPELDGGSFWLHAVSVGEVQASIPLVRALGRSFPDTPLLITTVTPTGAARVESIFGDSVHHCYIPFETPNAVKNFFDAVQPKIALIMETEIWPNLYHECGARRIPLVLVSARISPKSVKSYRKLLPLFRETLSHGIVIAAQSETDAERFRSLGARPERTRVTGNIKFDIEVPDDLVERGREFRKRYLGERPVWIAASTHHKEEEQVLEAHRQVLEQVADALLILVPRHPERFDSVRQLLERQDIGYVSRTSASEVDAGSSVFLGDTMGEVPLFYAASDVAFVGGTLVPVGGHNLLEPAALALPVVTGPHLFNTQDIADMFVNIGALTKVADLDQLAVAVTRLLQDEATAHRLGKLGRDVVQRNRGALGRLLSLLEPLIARALQGSVAS
ncbi:MAG TPA: lipid IV(A) 3-deoxy-D-manno-octulosonic acid transferase [Woeseiaceae bacterium]|nr:lipid IV(A) 3-deoxy-D-manno-octulosonic acid transferase [Woeseiaceae bacterium]